MMHMAKINRTYNMPAAPAAYDKRMEVTVGGTPSTAGPQVEAEIVPAQIEIAPPPAEPLKPVVAEAEVESPQDRWFAAKAFLVHANGDRELSVVINDGSHPDAVKLPQGQVFRLSLGDTAVYVLMTYATEEAQKDDSSADESGETEQTSGAAGELTDPQQTNQQAAEISAPEKEATA